MSMKQCPICGEEYSDTYKSCPFCEEEKAMKTGAPSRRAVKRSRQFSLITPTLVVLILIMVGLLVYLLYGDKIAKKPGGEDENPPGVNTVLPNDSTQDEEEEEPPVEPDPAEPDEEKTPGTSDEEKVTMPEDNGTAPAVKPQPQPKPTPQPKPPATTTTDGYAKAAALPAGLTLSSTDFTVKVAGESNVLRASGGSGTYQWYSEDPNVASVDANGKVTALSKGTVKIIATDGSKKGECIVRVNVSNTTPVTPPSEVNQPTNAKLNKEDYTTHVGDPDVKLTVSGASGKVTWTSGDSSIATVSADGVVKAVSKGTTTIKASVDGATLSCIVRVS